MHKLKQETRKRKTTELDRHPNPTINPNPNPNPYLVPVRYRSLAHVKHTCKYKTTNVVQILITEHSF